MNKLGCRFCDPLKYRARLFGHSRTLKSGHRPTISVYGQQIKRLAKAPGTMYPGSRDWVPTPCCPPSARVLKFPSAGQRGPYSVNIRKLTQYLQHR
jgi:hypothetical protein